MANEITIVLRDKVAAQVARLPNPQEFVHQAVEEALRKQTPPAAKLSKWARVVAEIENLPSLGEYEAEFRRSKEEFRRSFRFKHDEP
jgi:hypothetical protein